jgi:hypothetical protein
LVQRPDVEEERSRLDAIALSERFIDAHNSRDHEMARSLVSDTALISMNPAFSVDDLQMGIAWLEATGWVATSNGCSVAARPPASPKEAVRVFCALAHENDWSRVMGQPPDTRGGLALDVVAGEIRSALLSSSPMSFSHKAVKTFENWLAETHPEDLDVMYRYPRLPALTAESIALWREHTMEFVADQRG